METSRRARREQRARQRRRAWRAFGMAGALVAVVSVVGVVEQPRRESAQVATTRTPPEGSTPPPTSQPELPTVTTAPTGAAAVSLENQRPGSNAWPIPPERNNQTIMGFANRVSATSGDTITLFISTAATTYHVEVYRFGYYQGLGARLVERSADLPGQEQAAATVDPKTNMAEAPWNPSTTLTVGPDWFPGPYLLKLVTDSGDHYIPLTVRDPASTAAVLLLQANTSWQAYNDWGGYSLYKGPRGGSQRAKVVSFDRPYNDDGAGDFLANEFPLVSYLEELGLDVAYATTVDLHADPNLPQRHKALLSPGHDEYWSLPMRMGAEAARDKGVNIAFFGSNAVYRRIRLEPSPLGDHRREVNYRTTAGDPVAKENPELATTSWREGPAANPENSLVGNYYECNPVNDDGVVFDASSWVFAGTGLQNGDRLPLLVGTEYDRVQPNVKGTPPNIQVLMHSPLTCGGRKSFADVSYYTAPSNAGVFASGTNAWVCKLRSGCPADPPGQPDQKIRTITENVLRAFATGPAGIEHPSQANTDRLRTAR